MFHGQFPKMAFQRMTKSPQQTFRVKVPSRLHLGFVDMHGGLGRRFGGVGVALSRPRLDISVRPAASLEVTGEARDRVRTFAEYFLKSYPGTGAAHIEVHEAIPEHCGFGSGTQLTLAVAHGLARLSDLRLSSRDIMRVFGRGRRSGIGVAVFERGGVIVDGGKGGSNDPPPLLARLAFPEAWRIVLVTDNAAVGIHGAPESDTFGTLPGFSASCAGYLSRVVLMKLLPSVVESDFMAFSDATMRLQDCIGDYFSSAQGGRYASLKVSRVLEYLREHGVDGIGQSSWGPTGFVFVPDEERAQELVSMVGQALAGDTGVHLSIVRADNRGAEISTGPGIGL